jgi:hypothetical protein
MESRLKQARNLSLLAFLAGAVLVVIAAACGGSSNKKSTPSAQASATKSATATRTATATATSTPTATPTPFNGKVSKMLIPRFGVDAPVEALTVDSTNTMETPASGHELTDVGWYDSTLKPNASFLGTKPGWDGNAVFAAHVYWNSKPAPFNHVASIYGGAGLAAGDEVDIVMEDGTEYKYSVMAPAKEYNRDTIPMGDIISPPDRPAGAQWITLITCGGELDSTGQEYVNRSVVVAQRVS